MTEATLNSSSETTDYSLKEGSLPNVDVLDYLLFIPFFIVFLGTLIWYELRFRLATGASQDTLERLAGSFNRAVARSLKVVGVKVHITGLETYPTDRPYLIVSNHQSLFDISVLHQAFGPHRAKFVAKKELGRGVPGVSRCLRTEGSALIDRSNPRQAIPAIKDLGKRMEAQNFATILFPEGTRARRGRMKPFKTGGILNILKTSPRAEIIPVALDGSWKLAGRKLGPIPRGVRFEINVGKPIVRSGNDSEDATRVEPEIRRLLAEIRRGS